MDFEKILTVGNLALSIGIMGIIQALKITLTKLKVADSLYATIAIPWLPLVLGAIAGLSGIVGSDMKNGVVLGITVGAMSGQVWKILKTKIDILAKK